MRNSLSFLALTIGVSAMPVAAQSDDPDARAEATEKAMTQEERTVLTHGIMAIPLDPRMVIPQEATPGAGYIKGIERLGIPALRETDASLGVSYVGGLRNDGATALPSAMSMASTWNADLIRQGGAMIGGEARAKGFNILLAGGVNLLRDPRNGRTFEYLGEDPLLAGTLVGASIAGIQSTNMISTIKHFALNGQETGRHFAEVKISESAARESDLLAFQIGIEKGQPGSVMCAYNKINGQHGCDNDWLLNKVLKQDWGYKGFVMSDWGAVPGLQAAMNGLDQQSGSQLDDDVFFDKPLADAANKDPKYAARVSDMNRRILRSIYAAGIDTNPPIVKAIDFAANAMVAQRTAEEGIVLLKNANNALPLAASAKSIAVIGGYADTGVISGGGSSQVQGVGGPSIVIPNGGEGVIASILSESYHRSVPLKAIKALAPNAEVKYRNGNYITDAVIAAKQSDIAIVFATQWQTEGLDVPDLNLPKGQNALIAAVTEANPNTIVVLETGGPIVMPWLDKAAAVVQAWYPGARGAEAIAGVLFGNVNPSGHLPATFPASTDQLPRPRLDGSETVEPNFMGIGKPGQTLIIDYDVEGSDLGYRWFARKGETPLFPFGFGLSYTDFEYGDLQLTGDDIVTASFTIQNTGKRAGADVPQLYLLSAGGQVKQRLAGWSKVELEPGAKQKITVTVDNRILADWKANGWARKAGTYRFAIGHSATDLGTVSEISLAAGNYGP